MANSPRPQGHHDQLVAKFFEDTTLAQELLRQFLPAEPLEQFHLEGLEPIKNSFVDEELRRSYCDLCYKIPLRAAAGDSRVEGIVYVLIEHKSESDPFAPFQLLRYMVRIYEQESAKARHHPGFRLPPIIPMVLHHGRTEFRGPVDFQSLVAPVPGLESYVPKFSCVLVDLMAIPPEELPDSDERLYAVLSVMQSIFGEDLPRGLRQAVSRLAAKMERPEIQETFRILMQYVLQSANKITNEEIVEAIRPMGKLGDETMSTLVEKWREEGREEGQISDRQDSIIDILLVRFGVVPEPLCQAIRAITDRERLVRLTVQAVKCETIDQFAENVLR